MRLLPLLLVACELDEPDNGNVCTEIAMASVSLSVADLDGAPVTDATVTYTVDGGEATDCNPWADGQYACGWEQPGTIVVTVAKEGFVTVTEAVEVGMTDDECHVEGEVLAVTLEEVACTADIVHAVQATLVGSSGELLDNPLVWWGYAAADMEPVACLPDGDTWWCAEEAWGDIEVYGTADGHTTAMEAVTVEMDEYGCHPVTESVDLVVAWLPD
ncbi:MAG: carboxypeptidase regulatory-like domain-containing protein [Deltaproteobacteria bacterium]|nr:carboxypeptidase regulatory-like domain-containing protein [Deltaproteobacteria bacterium]